RVRARVGARRAAAPRPARAEAARLGADHAQGKGREARAAQGSADPEVQARGQARRAPRRVGRDLRRLGRARQELQPAAFPLEPAVQPEAVRRLGTAVGVAMFACAAPVAHGDTVYVTNNFGSSVSQYGVGAGGALAPKATPTVAAGTNPIAIVVSPDGRSVYVANNGSASVSQYTVRDDGTLAAKSPATVPAGTGPSAIAI